jgi:putative membrane protein
MASSIHFIRFRKVASYVTLAAGLVGGACNRGGEQYADTATGAVGSPAAPGAGTTPAAAPALGDPQIAHVAVTANSIDSAAGEFARTRAQNPRVKEFAQRMIRDHGAVNKQAVALATRLNMTPAENDVSRQLQQGDQQARNDLAGKRGADFDRAYIDREIQYHQSVIDALDKTLIPGAQNADLKALLQQVRPNVAAHLQLAQQIQSTLGRT